MVTYASTGFSSEFPLLLQDQLSESGAGQIKELILRKKAERIPVRTLFLHYFGGRRNKICYRIENNGPTRSSFTLLYFLKKQFQADGYVLLPEVNIEYLYENEILGAVTNPKLADFCDVSVYAVLMETYPLFEKVSALCSNELLNCIRSLSYESESFAELGVI